MITILKTALTYYFLALVCLFMMGFVYLFIRNMILSKKESLKNDNKQSFKEFFFKKRFIKKKVVDME